MEPKFEKMNAENEEEEASVGVHGIEPALNAALQESLQQMVRKAEKPMNIIHQRIYKYIIDIDQQLDQLSSENTNLKLENQAMSRAHRQTLAEREQALFEVGRERDEWKAKTEYLNDVLQKVSADSSDQSSEINALKGEREKLKVELAKTIKTSDLEQTKLEIKLHQLRKAHEDQTEELQKCQSLKRQMEEKIRTVEKNLRDAKIRLKREKKRWDWKGERESAEKARLVAEQAELQQKISVLEEKTREQEAAISRLVDGLVTDPLVSRLLKERFSQMKETNGNLEASVVIAPPPAVKRKAIAIEVADGRVGQATAKKTKVSGEGGGDLTEEGEIVDQEPQREKPVASCSLVAPPPPTTHAAASPMHPSPNIPRNRGNQCRRGAKSTPAPSRYHQQQQQQRFYPHHSHSNGTYKRGQR